MTTIQNILRPLYALAYPLLPIVPECSYCAAMRFGLISSIVTGLVIDGVSGLLLGTFIGLCSVYIAYIENKVLEKKSNSS